MVHMLSFKKLEKNDFKINVILKTIGKCMSFTIEQPKNQ